MKLSELVAFRNQLNALSVESARRLAADKLDVLVHKIEQPNEQPVEGLTQGFVSELKDKQNQIYQAFANFDQTVDQVKDTINKNINQLEKYWYQESYKLFEVAKDCEKPDQILYNRRVPVLVDDQPAKVHDILRGRLAKYTDWRSPGMLIRPGVDGIVHHMLGCDPLYLIDQDYDLLKPSIEGFSLIYQKRLRSYVTNEWSDSPILEKLPDGQFGICVVNSVFDYRPLEVIRRYLTEIYQKLKPGGALIMTYNDCDRESAVMLVEKFCTCYTPGYLIRDLAEGIGFEQTFTWDDGGPSVWLELRKPGEPKSLRGGQVITETRQMSECFYDLEFLKRTVYTNEQVQELRIKAMELNIDTDIIDQLCTTYPYELDHLINETQQRIQAEKEEQERFEKALEQAKEFNIDTTLPDWETKLEKALVIKEQERLRKEAEQRRLEIELEKKRIEDLHLRARSYNINPELYDREEEIHRLIAEAVDQLKKEELQQLRKRALELQAGNPNLIRYGYSAEKLKELIKLKEEENK